MYYNNTNINYTAEINAHVKSITDSSPCAIVTSQLVEETLLSTDSPCVAVTSQLVEETVLSTDSPCVAVTSQLVEETLLPDISSQTLKGTE